jgi:hypothetical protein
MKLTPKLSVSVIASRVEDWLSRHTSTSGGCNETGQKALTVKPLGAPEAAIVVTTVTPVGKLDMISRNSSSSTGTESYS